MNEIREYSPFTNIPPEDLYTRLVGQVMHIESITWGEDRQNFLARYHGHLLIDSSLAYDRLSLALRPMNITTLFRSEKGEHVVILVKGTVQPRPSNPWINLLLFILTLFSVFFAGAFFNYDGPLSTDLSIILPHVIRAIGYGLSFAVSLLAILVAHEFGHYLAARYHKTAVTLPYFIPFPFSPFGTMGAFIQLKEPPKNKRVLLDIGIAGPIAGLVVAIPVLLLGLYLSNLNRLPIGEGMGVSLEGNSILYLLAKYIVFGRWLPDPISFGNLPPLLYWIRYFFTGQPLPIGGTDVLLHPVAWAGWAGLLVTALNLIPAGQLDGGHILYVLLGRRTRNVLPFILIILVILGTVWSGWWLWAFLIFMLGRFHAEPLDQITPLDSSRRILAMIGIIIFFLVFTPVPLTLYGI
jgi:membrane-associated protease RseP (regulator of RpoE activity)